MTRTVRLLVVDDNAQNLYYLEALLGGSGYVVQTAHNGQEALNEARSDPPDLVVADLLMPVMDGYTLLRHWKADPALSTIPFIVYTATYTHPEDQKLALSMGADAFLVKPIEPEALLAHIQDVMTRHTPPTQPDNTPGEETVRLQQYNVALVHKLEERSLQLEEANRVLQQEIVERRRLAEMQISILNAVPAHIALVDTQGTILAVNEAWRRFGQANLLQTPHFGVGANYLDVCERAGDSCGAEAIQVAQGIRQVLNREIPEFSLQYPCHTDSELYWYRLMVTPLHADRMAGAVIMHVDVSDRMTAETSLRESEERFRQLAENINEVFWIYDPLKRRLLYVSPAYETVFGRSCDTLYQQPGSWVETIDPADRARVQTSWSQWSTRDYNETYRMAHPDGTTRWIRDRAFPVRDAQGKIYRLVGLTEDITGLKKIESQFLRAQRLESIGVLAGGIAHDLNNVLTPIMLSIELLKLEETDPWRLETLTTIEASAQHGADMVRQVLAFARGVEGRRVVVPLRNVVRDVVKIARETFPRNIEVLSDIPAGLWNVTGDPTQLHQVLINLAVNARDAMPHGGRITISAQNVTPDGRAGPLEVEMLPGPAVALDIEDNGTGMDADLLSKIFDPFFTTKGPASGTGLGLSTSMAIVKSHGGVLRAYSEPGNGSRFRVCLPADYSEADEAEAKPEAALPRGNGQLVLLVEDEAAVLSITRGTLEAFGYRVITAADGAEAVALFATRKNEVALVLSDLMMPVMDGLATARVLLHMRPNLPVILSSGLGGDSRLAEAAEIGVRHFMNKPYSTERLLTTLADILAEPSKKRER